MSGARPSLYKLDSWTTWERFCLSCLEAALEELAASQPLPDDENSLNGKLHACLRRAAKQIRPQGPWESPRYECPQQPYGESEESARRLKACPDFVWGFVDYQEPDPLRNAREFVIECKRLRAASRSWDYNESYVKDGVMRFIDLQKKYGIGVSSGAMVGYWQNMEAEEVLIEVNTTAKETQIAPLELSRGGWREGGISDLGHSLQRDFHVQRFALHHKWVDLRTPKRTELLKAVE